MTTKASNTKGASAKPVARKDGPATAEATETTTATEAAAEKPAKKERVKKEKAEKAPKEPKPKKEKPVRETPAHMAKVNKVKASLPPMSESAKAIFDQAAQLESLSDLNVLATHIAFLARERATAASNEVTVRTGDRVKIVSGSDVRFHGKEGEVVRTNRIRIFVRVPGFEKEAYLLRSNVELLESAPSKIDLSDDAPESEDQAANG
jgi:ribosomal protein L24